MEFLVVICRLLTALVVIEALVVESIPTPIR